MPATRTELLAQPVLIRLAVAVVDATAAARHRVVGALLSPRAPRRIAVLLSFVLLPGLCLAYAAVLVGLAYAVRGLCVAAVLVAPVGESVGRLVADIVAAL